MEAHTQQLVEKVWRKYKDTPNGQRLLIGVAGIPGSGKTTFCNGIVACLNKHAALETPNAEPPAACLPMDGFHYSRQYLDMQPDSTMLHDRRGAFFTFDAIKFQSLVCRLRNNGTLQETILAPSFDHATKDPKEDDIAISSAQRILFIEGNYIALDEPVWRNIASMMDELWFVNVDLDVARERLAARHVRSGIVATLDEGYKRADANDLVNAREILKERLSIEEEIYLN